MADAPAAPSGAAPAAPAQPAAKAPTTAPTAPDPKGAAAAAAAAGAQPAAPTAPANPIEADLAKKFPDHWDKLDASVKKALVDAEMKSREADKRMQLAAKIKKDLDLTQQQANQLIQALRENPWAVLSNPALGHDVRKMAEEYVWNMIQEQRMSPEQRKAKENELKLQQYEREKQEFQDKQKKAEMDQLVAQRRAYWEKAITEAIQTSNLPKTSYVVRRFAEHVKAYNRARVPADMPAIANAIQGELMKLQEHFLDSAPEDKLLSLIPPSLLKKLRKVDLANLRSKGLAPKPGPKPAGQLPAPDKKGNGKMSMSEWLDQRDQRLGH